MKRYRLGELVEVTRGMSLPGEYYSTSGSLVRLTLGNFNYAFGGFKTNTSKDNVFYTGTVKPEFILKKGDIITPLTEQTPGLLGSTARIPESGKYIQSQDIGLVKCKEGRIDPCFCYYLLSSASVKKQLGSSAQQTKIRHTSPDKIKDVIVDIPSLSDQQAIGRFLDTIDARIANARETNDYLAAMAKLLYNYWFVQFEFPDENGKPYKSSGGEMVWNEKLKRVLPIGWSECTLSHYIGRITNGLNPRANFVLGKGNNYYITIRSLTGTDIDWSNCDKCDDEALEKINSRSQLQVGDIIFSAIGTIGRSYLIQEQPNNWNISETSFTIRPAKEIPSSFLYSLLRSDEIQLLTDKAAMGSTLRCLVMESLKQVPTIKVPKKVITIFSEIVMPWYAQMYNLNNQIRELQNYKDSILCLLMNGQVSVRPLNNHLSAD